MNAQFLPRSDLSDAQVDAMLRLLTRHFSGVTRPSFLADLDDKSHALLLTDTAHRLLGFSTLDFRLTSFRGQTESLVFSGDTIMDPESWNSTILSRAWIEAVYMLHARIGQGPLWWLLITSGFRTYRLLPVFWREFFPHCHADPPPDVSARLAAFARDRFGPAFDPVTGIVRLSHPQRLRPHLQGVPIKRTRNRHVAFFNQRNPGHPDGDELACLTRLDPANLTRAGQRIVNTIRQHPVLSQR
jgi:hypothetical protein